MSDDPSAQAVATTQSLEPTLLNFVAQAVRDPNIDVTKLEALLRIQREIVADDAKSQFNQAFLRLQARLPRVKKNGVLEYPKNRNDPEGPKKKIASFARYEDIMQEIGHLLQEEGFAPGFNTVPRPGDGGGIIVTCILRHTAGYSTETSIPVPLDNSGGKNALQGYGSSLSYGKRYALTAAINLITEGEDDDGRRGGQRFITDEQATELRNLCQQAGRDEGGFLQQMFAGTDVRSFEEIEAANYIVVKNTLGSIIDRKNKRKGEPT